MEINTTNTNRKEKRKKLNREKEEREKTVADLSSFLHTHGNKETVYRMEPLDR